MEPEQIVKATAFMFGVDRAAIFGNGRSARVTEARHALAWALRQSAWSLMEIGAFLHRDHTTIIDALKSVERKRQTNARFAERLAQIALPIDPPVDWHARVAALEQRVAELEALLQEARRG